MANNSDLPSILRFSSECFLNISSMNVSISSSLADLSRFVILVRTNRITISLFTKNELAHECHFNCLSDIIIPTSFKSITGQVSLIHESEESDILRAEYEHSSHTKPLIQFRLQIDTSEVNMSDDLPTTRKIQIEIPYDVQCSACKYKLLANPVTFRAISRVPSNIEEVIENFFCHQHDNESSIELKHNTLLTSLTTYTLDCLNYNSVSENETSCVFQCRKCNSILSPKIKDRNKLKDNAIPCFKDKIIFVPLDLKQELPNEGSPLKVLSNMVDDSLATSLVCKLFIEPVIPTDESKCLLFWCIDPVVKRYDCCQNKLGFYCEDICFKSVMKVFYHIANSDSKLATDWRRAFATDFQVVSNTAFQEICNALIKNANPSYERNPISSEFIISYLPNGA